MIPLDEALRIVLEHTVRLERDTVPCPEAAGAWLHEPVDSDVDLPPSDVSAMDGYALRAEDVASVPVDLAVVGEIPAGATPDFTIGTGQAAKIMTGAPLPAGADAVQMVEKTEEWEGGARVRVLEPVTRAAHVRRCGENLRRGEPLLPAGKRLGPVEVGLLSGAGAVTVPVSRRPRVGLVPTGNELVEPGARPGPGQIRNTNGPTLQALVMAEGGRTVYLGVARDDPASIDSKIALGLEQDVLLLSGGVSMGAYDLVTEALGRAGVQTLFQRVAVKPGKPTVFGLHKGPSRTALVFGLPGNPVSGLVIFRLLVAPALRRMQGASSVVEARVTARLAGRLAATPRREAFHPARIGWVESGYAAKPVAHHGSGDLVAWREANGMVHLPADTGAEPGDTVEVLLDRDHDLR